MNHIKKNHVEIKIKYLMSGTATGWVFNIDLKVITYNNTCIYILNKIESFNLIAYRYVQQY